MKAFDKYHTRSADHHYHQIGRGSFKDYSAPVEARFKKLVENVGKSGVTAGNILDVGSGDGVALELIARAYPHLKLYGIEPVPEAIAVATKNIPQGHFVEGTAEKLPFPDGFFDLVISSDVIEHVDDPEQMLAEIKRVTKSGATLVIGTPIRHSKFPLDHNHVQEFFVEDFEEMLKRHFAAVELHESHDLSWLLFYHKPTRSFLNFKYFVNLLSLWFGWNPFMRERRNRVEMFAYMYAICRK